METGTGGSRLARIASRLESKILRSADGVTAIHDRFKRHMVDALGVPAGQVEVIRNWTHLSVPPHTETKDVRARLGWTPGDVIVLHAGNMGKKQGLENVVEAARIAEERGSAVHFVLMGNGNQRHRLEELAKGLSRISFVDPLPGPEFQRALAAADILLVNELPGLKDMAVPSKLTSYFNSGTPVLAATDPGSVTAYEIAHSRGGLLVAAGDAVALMEAAETLAGDPAGGARLAANALHFRRETLSESLAIAHYDEFITRLASSRGR